MLESDSNFSKSLLEKSFKDTQGMINIVPFSPLEDLYLFEDKVVLSGFLGDPLFGSWLPSENSTGLKIEDLIYSKVSQISDTKLRKLYPLFDNTVVKHDISKSIEKDSGVPDNRVIQNWTFMNKGMNYSNYAVFKNVAKIRYVSPFLDHSLRSFLESLVMFSSKIEDFRKKFIKNLKSDISLFPIKSNYNLPIDYSNIRYTLNRSRFKSIKLLNRMSNFLLRKNLAFSPMDNYIDYNNFLRTDKEFKSTFFNELSLLKSREIFDSNYIDKLWKNHQLGFQNNFTILSHLVSLEIAMQKFGVNG